MVISLNLLFKQYRCVFIFDGSRYPASEPTQSLLFLSEKKQMPMLVSSVRPDRNSNPRSTALEESTLTRHQFD
jgi:hypothetical protein